MSIHDQRFGTRPEPRWDKRRMHHVFAADGRAVVVAMDHGNTGVVPGLIDVKNAVQQVVAGGADAVMTTIGMGRVVRDELGAAGSIIALDSERSAVGYGIDAALRFGADAVELKVFPGSPADDKLGELRELAAMASAYGLPFLAEAIPVSFTATEAHTVANIADAARICAEAGADFIKVPFAGTVREYRAVIEAAFVPVVVLGGARLAESGRRPADFGRGHGGRRARRGVRPQRVPVGRPGPDGGGPGQGRARRGDRRERGGPAGGVSGAHR